MTNNRKTKKEGMQWPFTGGCSFYMKNRLKSEIFNVKKTLWIIMLFSVRNNNLNWEISTKNLKDGMRLMIKIVNIMGVHWKTCLKRGAWIVWRFKRIIGKRKGHVFEVGRGWDPNAHYELEQPSYWHKYPKQITL